MAKKETKEKEVTKSTNKKGCFSRTYSFFNDERTRVVAGLLIIIVCMYTLLAFVSFFFTGFVPTPERCLS